MKTLKSLEARQIEARSRARMRGVRVEVVVPQRHYRARSLTDPTITYNLDRTSAGWECECKGYEFTGSCQHLGALERRSEREGWAFGKVAKTVMQETRERALAMLVKQPA